MPDVRESRTMIRLAGAALALALAACSPEYGDAYLSAIAAGQRALHAGRYVEAANAYEDASGRAKRVKDRDEALFMKARALERGGRFGEARAAYQRLRATSPDGPRAGRAAFDLAELEIRHGDAAAGWRMLDETIRAYPQHGVTRLAIRRIVEHEEERGGEAAVMAWLDARAPAFKGTDQEEVFAYERARSLRRAGRKQEAHDLCVATATRWAYPRGSFTADTLWDAAEIDRELGRPAEAIDHLKLLVSHRERADTTGSYERPRYIYAQLRIAEIYRDDLKDHASARRELHRVYTDYKLSIRRDDALWEEARLAREDGDREVACDLTARLVKEFPLSRYAGCARELCPSAPAGKRECARYVKRELGVPDPPDE